MTDTFAARILVDRTRETTDAARARADEQAAVLHRLQDEARHGTAGAAELAAAAAVRHAELNRAADELAAALASAEDELARAVEAAPPLFADANTDPVALLPVRLETVWWDARSLRVRVYPDDIHVSRFEPALSPVEADAGAAYWRSPGPDAWQDVLGRLRPARAAWAVRATRPDAPPPAVRPGGCAVGMPNRWRFVGIVTGEVVIDALGRPVADPLPIGLLRTEPGWEVDWFTALKAGMAIELTMPPGVDHLDHLLVVGVRNEPGPAGAARMRDLLLGHLFGTGLGLLPAGTPTNNTPGSRSGWSSRPAFPPPGDDPPGPVADQLAAALGLPDAGFLRGCTGAADPEPAAVAGLSLLTWATLGKGFVESAATHLDLADRSVRGVDPGRAWRTVRDHLAGHVRGRGPLPMLRVGRQPYGVLPATALSDWRVDRDRDPDALLLPWLRRLTNRWRAVLDDVPRVRPGTPVDHVAVDVLTRLPAATGLAMRRMNGPGFTVPRTPRDQPPAAHGVPGLAADSELRWTTRSDTWTDLGWSPDPVTGEPGFVKRLAPGPAFTDAVVATADRLRDVRAFLTGALDAAGYDRNWPVETSARTETPVRRTTLYDLPDDGGLIWALLFIPNWAFQDGDDGQDDPVRQAFAVPDEVDQIVTDVLDRTHDPDRDERIAAGARWSDGLTRLERALRAVAAVPAARLPELLLEIVDGYGHRLDAWVTSVASLRLARLRATGVAGLRVGGYGWVEDLRPGPAREEVDLGEEDGIALVSEQDGYLHAPSLHHAATAAVLRSGFLAHPGEETFAVNLDSRRARTARWLLAGVRRGQSLGTLLGYRFERAMHDAGLDTSVPAYRLAFPTTTVDEPATPGADAALWSRSTEAIAASNVVDGMALVRAGQDARLIAEDPDLAGPILADLADALDAVADAMLAESVHQLVGGNPIRAGLAADTLGRGEDVPDTLHVLRTPHRARALTHRVVAVLPAGTPEPSGWAADAVAALEPAVEAWVAHLLGPATDWTLAGTVGARPFTLTADRLGLGCLATVLDAAGAERERLRRAVVAAVGAGADEPVSFAGDGWTGLHAMATRIRALLATAQPVQPVHLMGDPGIDVADTRRRLAAFAATVAGQPGVDDLVALAAEPATDTAGWLARARSALAPLLGAEIPLLPVLTGPVPAARADVSGADAGDWLGRFAAVRPVARTLHETLLVAGARTGRWDRLGVTQDPAGPRDPWIGGTFPADRRPPASTHLVLHAPRPIAAAFAGLLLDEWVEVLPGADGVTATTPDAELTGVAFHYDRPDAKAPQTVLIAVPPDLDRGWTADGLVQVLRETLELAKLRAVDLADLGPTGDLVPAVLIPPTGATGQALIAAETFRPNTDPDGPFRLEPGHRRQDVDSGLAARVFDPLWLLTRQWQFGEFAGQDAGSPAVVRLVGSSAPIDAWRPAADPSWVLYDPRRGPLDAAVEAEPALVDERLRAEGGAHLLRMLADAGLPATTLAPHLLPAGPVGSGGLVGRCAGRVPDAAAVAAAAEAGLLDPAIGAVAGAWQRWWAARSGGRTTDCFDPHRFEHGAALSTRGAVLRADEYLGDGLDWFSVDIDPDADAAPQRPRRRFSDEAIPSALRYAGMPADRFWEMEDALVDLGAADVSTLDTGRLLLIAFATVYGNDWYLLPVEVATGSFTVLDRLVVRDVFDRTHLLRRAGRDDPAWSMFTLHGPDPDHIAANGLLVLPTGVGQAGEPIERVGLARDELANLAWAIQHDYTDGGGERVTPRDAWSGRAPQAPPPDREIPAYGVRTVVPDYWHPLVPEAVRPGVIRFRRADDTAAEGRLVPPDLWVHEEEIPREGLSVSRRPVVARWFDGSWHSWVRREKAPGGGESSSGLAFDTVRPTGPWPD